MDLLRLNNREFHVEFEKAAREDQRTTMVVLEFINDCERRMSYLDVGYSSVGDYCVRKLEYPSSTAARYILAARCIRHNPEVFEMLERREVSVTSICQFASILDESNKELILPQVKGASWRDVERMARKFRPPVELCDRMDYVQANTTDGGQCTFVAPDGTRCQCRRDLQIDHIKPVANDGPIDVANLRLLCGGHNRLMAERTMGMHVMRPYWRQQ